MRKKGVGSYCDPWIIIVKSVKNSSTVTLGRNVLKWTGTEVKKEFWRT